MRGTWQTTEGGGGTVAVAVLVIAAVLVVEAVARPVINAATDIVTAIVHIVLIGLATLAGLAVAGTVGYLAWRRHRPRPAEIQYTVPSAIRSEPQRALPPVQQHIHFHGVSAEDIAAVLARRENPQ